MIPIYRAKKIDSDEYVEGFLYQDIISYAPSNGVNPDEYNKALDEESWFLMDNIGRNEMIDKTTLSIHFPGMLDSNGNKIFASLQEDGKGGDILEVFNIDQKEYQDGYCLYSTWEKGIRLSNGSYEVDYDIFGSLKVIGIKD